MQPINVNTEEHNAEEPKRVSTEQFKKSSTKRRIQRKTNEKVDEHLRQVVKTEEERGTQTYTMDRIIDHRRNRSSRNKYAEYSETLYGLR